MKEFPLRDIKHITETDSYQILNKSIPSNWILREITERDYGIDCYIEIVGKSNRITRESAATSVLRKEGIIHGRKTFIMQTKDNQINVFLITPQTSVERIEFIDSISNGFLYMVSSASVTGSSSGFGDLQTDYFKRIADMNLKNPQIVGFGISNHYTFSQATKFAKEAIIGSAFIKHLTKEGVHTISDFISSIKYS